MKPWPFIFIALLAALLLTGASEAKAFSKTTGLKTFAYDSENQLTNVFVPGQWRSDFIYDGLNRRRIERDYSWNGTTWMETNETHFVCDGYLPIQERDANNHVLVTYTRGLDLSDSLNGAGGIDGLLARTDANGSTFYHADASGNITALMDGSENVIARYLYNPFGRIIGKWGPLADANEMQFSSMPHHNLSGMSLYPFRAYEPNLQRWLNQDPIGERGGLNLYGFVGNDPINRIDLFGLQIPPFEDREDRNESIPEDAKTPQERFDDNLANNQVFGAQRERSIFDYEPDPNWENKPRPSEKEWKDYWRMNFQPLESFSYEEANRSRDGKPYSNPQCRPKYADGQVPAVWNNAKQDDGRVYDPYTGKELFWDQSKPRDGQWDMGHYGQTYQDLYDDYMSGNISLTEFLMEYRDPNNYRPMSVNANRSRRYD